MVRLYVERERAASMCFLFGVCIQVMRYVKTRTLYRPLYS